MPDKLNDLISSRRFWVALAGGLVAFSDQLGIKLDPETIQALVLLIGSWVISDGLRETKKRADDPDVADHKLTVKSLAQRVQSMESQIDKHWTEGRPGQSSDRIQPRN